MPEYENRRIDPNDLRTLSEGAGVRLATIADAVKQGAAIGTEATSELKEILIEMAEIREAARKILREDFGGQYP